MVDVRDLAAMWVFLLQSAGLRLEVNPGGVFGPFWEDRTFVC